MRWASAALERRARQLSKGSGRGSHCVLSGPVKLGYALGILDSLGRRTTAQLLLRREEARFMDKGEWVNAEGVVILSATRL